MASPEQQLAYIKDACDKVECLVDMLSAWEALDEASRELPTLKLLRDEIGTGSLRMIAIALHGYACKVWDEFEVDEFQGAYDWEFLPDLISKIDWSRRVFCEGYFLIDGLPEPATMARMVRPKDEEVDISEVLLSAIMTDGDGIDGRRIVRAYDDADETGKAIIDDILISICGWSVPTLKGAVPQ